MAERPVVNTSPLILLAKAGLLELLLLEGPEIVVPVPVMREVETHGVADPAARAILESTWLKKTETPAAPAAIVAWDLGEGETAVLAWGQAHPGTVCIIDDLAARRCAATMGIPVRGTLGLVLAAKIRGRISAARPVMHQLRHCGMYLSDKLLNESLSLVGE